MIICFVEIIMVITGAIIKSVKSARADLFCFQNPRIKVKNITETGKDLKYKVITAEIEEVCNQCLLTSITDLIKNADELALKVEETNNFQT